MKHFLGMLNAFMVFLRSDQPRKTYASGEGQCGAWMCRGYVGVQWFVRRRRQGDPEHVPGLLTRNISFVEGG